MSPADQTGAKTLPLSACTLILLFPSLVMTYRSTYIHPTPKLWPRGSVLQNWTDMRTLLLDRSEFRPLTISSPSASHDVRNSGANNRKNTDRDLAPVKYADRQSLKTGEGPNVLLSNDTLSSLDHSTLDGRAKRSGGAHMLDFVYKQTNMSYRRKRQPYTNNSLHVAGYTQFYISAADTHNHPKLTFQGQVMDQMASVDTNRASRFGGRRRLLQTSPPDEPGIDQDSYFKNFDPLAPRVSPRSHLTSSTPAPDSIFSALGTTAASSDEISSHKYLFRDSSTVTMAANYSHDETEVRHIRSNVTSLLDTLMLSYDRRLRPGFGGSPVVVKADIEIRSMGPISEKDMVYSLDCYFRQVWTDTRLSFNATSERVNNVSLNVKMLERIWRPDTIFINGGPSYVHTITTPNKFFRLSPDGTILYSQRLTIKASCPMHLENFPMDTQKCPLHIASFGYPVDDVIYEWHYGNDLAAVASNDMRLSQFDLKGMPACNLTKEFKGTQHSVLTVFFDFRRHTGYFLIQIYLPCCLLVVLSWVSFWINREATSDRINLGATTMLTMTFLVLDSRNDLPRVSYSTALDIYVIMCFCFIFASILQFAAVHFFTKYGTDDLEVRPMLDTDDEDDEEDVFESGESNNDDPKSTHADPFMVCLVKMWRCIRSTRSRRFNKNVRNAMGLNSVSKIDKVSRVLFPAAFSGLNIVYWMSYW